jgi:hypothetical protein
MLRNIFIDEWDRDAPRDRAFAALRTDNVSGVVEART